MANDLHQRALSAVNPDRMLGILRRMVQFHSFSNTPGERDLARWLVEDLGRRGLETSLQPVPPDRLNALTWLRGKGGGPSLMFNGHMDTNMVGEGWTKDPWAAEVDDQFVYGIGVSNMKSGDAAMIEAILAVRDAGIQLAGDVCLALVVGELQGGVGTLALLDAGVRTDYFLVSEPSDLSIRTLLAGCFEFAIDVIGETRHIAKMEYGVNAIEKAFSVIQQLKKVKFSGVEERPVYAGLNRMNIGVIRGGVGRDYEEWRVPLVPDFCTVKVACRIAPSQTPETALGDVDAALKELQRQDPQLKYEIHRVPPEIDCCFPAFEQDPRHPFVRRLAAAHREITGREPLDGNVAPYKYGCNDAARLAQRGMIGAVYGPSGRYNTQPDERVEIANIITAAKVFALMIVDTCAPPR